MFVRNIERWEPSHLPRMNGTETCSIGQIGKDKTSNGEGFILPPFLHISATANLLTTKFLGQDVNCVDSCLFILAVTTTCWFGTAGVWSDGSVSSPKVVNCVDSYLFRLASMTTRLVPVGTGGARHDGYDVLPRV